MNEHFRARIAALFAQHDTATLATCGPGGPQISVVHYRTQQLELHLLIPHTSDHRFNLETQPEIALLTPSWKLHGSISTHEAERTTQEWLASFAVKPTRLHILGADRQTIIETIDF